MMRLFFAPGCPFAHRTRAMLTRLGQPFEPREYDPSNKPAELLALSPIAASPLLDDDGFVLSESAVINEYLAEKLTWRDAFAADAQLRARQRLSMKRFDEVVVPAAYASFKDPSTLEAKPMWRKDLEHLETTVKQSAPESLLGLHLAPHTMRWEWAFGENQLVRELGRICGDFLAAATSLPCVVATSPQREAITVLLRKRFGPPAP